MLPIEDDLVFRIGHRGRSKGQFTNPQVLFELWLETDWTVDLEIAVGNL